MVHVSLKSCCGHTAWVQLFVHCIQEYYASILKKLKEVGASSRQSDFYV